MSLYDLLIRNGTVVNDSQAMQADIAIADGRIVAIEPELAGDAGTTIEAQGLTIFPGVIDAHVHFNDPGRSEWEGIATGTRALAAGGTTAFFDMPLNASPPTLDAESFGQKLTAAEQSSLVDFALWGGLVPGNLDQLAALSECGVIGFKAFMSNSGIDDFQASDDFTLYEGMRRIAQLDGLVAVHAENDGITSRLAQDAIAHGRTGVRDYLRSRPIVAELEAIERAILFAQETGCRLHIVHVSSGRGISLVAEAQARGVDVTCETCAHYLVLTEEDVERLGAVAKCAPPLRAQEEQDALWQHLANGAIPFVTTDHSPGLPSMKTGDVFFAIWGGISGCQTLLQLLLTEGYARRHLPLSLIAAVTSAQVAQRFKLPAEKGRIAIGNDADLVFVDLEQGHVLQTDDLFYRHKVSPYVGMQLQGRIVRTLLRGQTVYADGKHTNVVRGRLLQPVTR
jgi:allantoinase